MANIESILQEHRVFPPSADFVKQANISGMDAYKALCAEADRDYTGFWGRLGREHVLWHKPFTQVLDYSRPPFARWFSDAICVTISSRRMLTSGGASTPMSAFDYRVPKTARPRTRVCLELGTEKVERMSVLYLPSFFIERE